MVINENKRRNHNNQGIRKETMRCKLKVYENKTENKTERDTCVTLEHKTIHKQHRYICSNSQQYIVWVKIIHFYFMTKRILSKSCSMKIFIKFPTINISKLHFLISNMHWKELHLDNFKGNILNI